MLGVTRVVGEQEVGILLRFGKPRAPVNGPARIWTIPRIDDLIVLDMRPLVIEVPSIAALTKDHKSIEVHARVHAQVVAPIEAAIRVVNYVKATSQLSEAALRAVLKDHSRDEALFERADVEAKLRKVIDKETVSWGVEVSGVELEVADAPAAEPA